MNHPYMYPEDAPWTTEYLERQLEMEERIRHQQELQILQDEDDFNARFARRPGR